MILPDKYIPLHYSLLGVGALVLNHLDKPRTISSLWEEMKILPEVRTFQRLVFSLDFLFIIGAVEIESGLLRKCR